MAFIDADEFIFSEFPIIETINEIIFKTRGAAGVGINWCLFGSSGIINKSDELVTNRFVKRGEQQYWGNRHIKTICNPRLVKNYVSPHYPLYKLGAFSINENGNRLWAWFNKPVIWKKLRINHYFCKSKEEFLLKRNRGLADREELYEMSKFNTYDVNDIVDMSICDNIDA